MSVLHVEYDMEVRYAQPVVKSFFTIKCMPVDDQRQRVLGVRVTPEVVVTPEVAVPDGIPTPEVAGSSFTPTPEVAGSSMPPGMHPTPEVAVPSGVSYSTGLDSFGNRQIYGSILIPHKCFKFHMSGDVETLDTPEVMDILATPTPEVAGSSVPPSMHPTPEVAVGIYRYPHGKCMPWPDAEEFLRRLPLNRCATEYDRCLVVLEALHSRLSYVKNATTVYTTAQQAWEKGCGVCQDFAHIYITLLRMAGIPARYVCGFVVGEGESHAWVEAFCEGKWIALDPTQGSVISYKYIKSGHGRDATDCAINRGIIWGGGAQDQLVRVKVMQQ